MTLSEMLTELEALGVMPTSMPSIEPIKRALKRAGLLEIIDPNKNIIIAGTNGKGTTAAALSALFHGMGTSVGLYTSPHLVSITERFRICESDVSDWVLVQTYLELKPIIFAEKLTHFEALTLMATHLFFSGKFLKKVKWAIWEVGLGGLFDATNAIPHHYSLLTKMGLDHENILGKTLDEIVPQKWGVIAHQGTVFSLPIENETTALKKIRENLIQTKNCTWTVVQSPLSPEINVPLEGKRARENASLAWSFFQSLQLDELHTSPSPKGLLHIRWPGRFSPIQIPTLKCQAVISGDHNPQGMRSLLEILSEKKYRKLHLILGIGKDKDANSILEICSKIRDVKIYLTETPFRGTAISDYPQVVTQYATQIEQDVFKLLADISRLAQSEDLLVISGSLYLVGQILDRYR